MRWTDEDERALSAFRRAYEGDGLTPWRSLHRYRRAFWIASVVAGIQSVVIAAVLIERWLQ
jgi:hypothetical protein